MPKNLILFENVFFCKVHGWGFIEEECFVPYLFCNNSYILHDFSWLLSW